MAYHLRGQAQYPFKPLAAIKAHQARRVRRMVAYAYRHVPYYRETLDRLGLSPADFRSADDLTRLPLLDRARVQRDPEHFVSTAQPLASYLQIRNSGTTSRPCRFYHDARALYQYAAHSGRARGVFAPLIGRSMGYRKTMIVGSRGSADSVQQFYHRQALLPPGVRLHRQQLSHFDPPETNSRLINEFKPDVIHSYGSYLAMLFAYLRASEEHFHRPKAILYTADNLPETSRHWIQEEFGIPVFSIYEEVEAYSIGFECEQDSGLHLNIDLCPVRIVDAEGSTLPIGESGDVVVSNLVNRATVLLSHNLGDTAAILPERCPCGRSLPVLSHLQGRSADWIKLSSGHLLHPPGMGKAFRQGNIWHWQLVQETITHFCAALVVAEQRDRQTTKERVAAALEEMLGKNITVDIDFVDSIQRTPAGKVRTVISLCALGGATSPKSD
jgi:phenylacetate-CoA ligase